MGMLGRAYRGLCAVEARLAALLLLLMVALIFGGGVARMAGHPINWAIDVASACFAWACFLCADIAWRRDALMSVDLLIQGLGPAARRVLRIINLLLITAFLGYAVVMGLWLSWVSRTRSFQGMSDVSYSWVTMSMPIGALLLLVTTLLKLRREFPAASPSPVSAA